MPNSAFEELFEEFLLEARERADEVESLLLALPEADPGERSASIAQTKRQLHTLKGNSGMMGFTELQQMAHRLEDQVEGLDVDEPAIGSLLEGVDRLRRELAAVAEPEKAGEAAPEQAGEEPAESQLQDLRSGSVRLPFSKIDQLVEMLAEIVIFRNRLSEAIGRGLVFARRLEAGGALEGEEVVAGSSAAWEEVELAHQALEKTLNLFQEQVTDLGMVPLQSLFRSLGRLVHDESERQGKRVELTTEGGETPIDKTLLEVAAEALGHLVRNAVIHGIEAPEKRRAAGKPAKGSVRVSASIDGRQVVIEVADDGRGIDAEALRRKRGSGGEGGAEDLLAMIFEEGVSTHEGTDIGAGRGVGLSAVKKSVERHGGRVEVATEPGQGSRFRLRLPVLASILRSLLLVADGEEYALPLGAVAETLRLEPGRLHHVNHAAVLSWRERLVPVLDLGLTFATAEVPRAEGYVILIDVNGRYRGLAADDIVGIRDIVVKGLDSIVGSPTGISGSTILGDGRVIMILDPAALAAVPPYVADPR